MISIIMPRMYEKLLIVSVALLKFKPIVLFSNSAITAQIYCMATCGKIESANLAPVGDVAD